MAPVNCIGELYLEGPILAREYLNDPQKTQAAFVVNPTWATDFQAPSDLRKFYATGDLVKYNPIGDGSLIYVGRRDNQVKINGQRVELGEIEAKIKAASAEIAEVVVHLVASDAFGGKKTLMAALVLGRDQSQPASPDLVSPSDDSRRLLASIRARLTKSLPGYMIPDYYIQFASLPTNNGKLDRKTLLGKLKPLQLQHLNKYLTARERRPATTSAELQLRGFWSQTLRIKAEEISIDDNFMQFGDSISAMRLVVLLQQYGINLTVAKMYQHPTLGEMAATIEESSIDATYRDAGPFSLCNSNDVSGLRQELAKACGVRATDIVDAYPATPLQAGLIMSTNRFSDSYIARLAYEIPENVDTDRLLAACFNLHKDSEILRTRIVHVDDGTFLQVVCDETLDVKRLEFLDAFTVLDKATPMTFGSSLARFALVSEDKKYLAISLHHAVYDGWSLNLMFQRLAQMYHGQAVPITTPFKAFINYLDTADKSKQVSFWQDQLGQTRATHWPAPMKGQSNGYQQRSLHRQLPLQHSRRSQALHGTALRAAYALAMTHFAGSDDIVFGVTTSGRNVDVLGASEMVGPLIATSPLRVRISSQLSVGQYMKQIQDQAVAMVPFEHVGLQHIARMGEPGSSVQAATDIQNSFIVQVPDEKEDRVQLLDLKPVTIASGDFDTYSLNVECDITDDVARAEVIYDNRAIGDERLSWFIDHFLHLTQQLLSAEDDQTLGTLAMLNSAGKKQVQHAAATPAAQVYGRELAEKRLQLSDLSDIRCWIVDENDPGQLAATGAVGELLIESSCYEQDKSRGFIDNPSWLASINGGRPTRVWQTNELAYWNDNEELISVGRKDRRFQVAGQRIQADQMETEVLKMAKISQAFVFVATHGAFKDELVIASISEVATSTESDGPTLCPLSHADVANLSMSISTSTRDLFRLQSLPVVLCFGTGQDTAEKFSLEAVTTAVQELDSNICEEVKQRFDRSLVKAETPSERTIQDACTQILNSKKPIDLDLSFVAAGGDSISAMALVSRCRKAGLALTTSQILQGTNLSSLAKLASKLVATSNAFEEDLANTNFQLSPIQKVFFDEIASEQGVHAARMNQSFVLRIMRPTSQGAIKDALDKVVATHSMLRARFSVDAAGNWSQKVVPASSSAYAFALHDQVPGHAYVAKILEHSQERVNIEEGPIFIADLCNVNDSSQVLVLVAHHLAVDLVSWRIIADDLESLISGQQASLETTTPFRAWIRSLEQHFCDLPKSDMPQPDLSYWDMSTAANLNRDTYVRTIQVDAESTSLLLTKATQTLSANVSDVLLASILLAFFQVFEDRSSMSLLLEGHGRDTWENTHDPLRTVGWLTEMSPMCIASTTDGLALTAEVKDQRQQLKDYQKSSLASNLFSRRQDDRRHPINASTELLFNYHGQFQQLEGDDSLFQDDNLSEHGVTDEGATLRRQGLVEIEASVSQGITELSFHINKHMSRQEELERWVEASARAVVSLCAQLTQTASRKTRSDFLDLSLDTHGFAALQNHLTRMKVESRIGENDIEHIFKCSPLQDGILLSQMRSPGTYETSNIVRVQPPAGSSRSVNLEGLIGAWHQLGMRHSSLRTIFIESVVPGAAFNQISLKQPTGDVSVIKAESPGDAIFKLQNLEPFQYKAYRSPHRLTICQALDGACFAKIEMSHAITDGGSTDILMHDWSLAYHESLPKTPALHYRDFIAHLDRTAKTEHIKYWASLLKGVEPNEFPRLAEKGSAKEMKTAVKFLDGQKRITGYCRGQSITPASLLTTAWAVTLSRFTGSVRPCFGYLASGRDVPVEGIEDAVGAFVNMLVCYVDLAASPSAGDLCSQVQNQFVESLTHQHQPLAEVQHALGLSEQSLFDTVISIQSDKDSITRSSTLSFESVESLDPTEYKVAIDFTIGETSIEMSLDYSTDTVSDSAAGRILNTYQRVVDFILSHDSNNITAAPLLAVSDMELLKNFNGDIPEPVNDCIHNVIRNQVARSPHSPALCAFDLATEMDYATLDDLSDRLANSILNRNVSHQDKVLLCFDKSSAAVITMLATLKSGLVIVPVGPSQPMQRLTQIAADAEVAIILGDAVHMEQFESIDVPKYSIDLQQIEHLEKPAVPLRSRSKPNDTAWIQFTSGSTGVPKGVVLSHKALCTSALAHGSAMGINIGTRVLQFAAYTFDVSIQDIFTTLQRGATVCVISEEDRLSALPEAINRTRANWADLTSTVAGLLNPLEIPTLANGTISLGGEALSSAVADMWEQNGTCEIFNGYGPAEASINSACSTKAQRGGNAANIGYPLSSWFWVTQHDKPDILVPPGCIGELLLEGPLLSDGYLKDDEKTAAAFITPSWAPNRRMYRTGDLVRQNDADGSFEYVGRGDRQIKLYGQRVELGEIEAALKVALPTDIRQSVADVVYPDAYAGKKTLACFLDMTSVEHQKSKVLDMPSAVMDQLVAAKTALQRTLPRHMIPEIFVPFSKLPRNLSGKLDRRTLQSSCQGLDAEQLATFSLNIRSDEQPVSPAQLKVQKLWAHVLEVPPESIGVNDNFFASGGDSVRAMGLAAAARQSDIALSVAVIFKNPKLCDMALHLTKNKIEGTQAEVLPFALCPEEHLEHVLNEAESQLNIPSKAIEDVYPCTWLQLGMLSRTSRQADAYVAQHVYKVPAGVDIARLYQAWSILVSHHSILRTRIFYATGLKQHMQAVCPPEQIKWRQDSSLERYLELQKQETLGIGTSLSQFGIVQSEEDNYLIWTAHHAVYDGWSVQLLLQDLERAYSGHSIPNAPSMRDLVAQLQRAPSEDLERYWSEQFAGDTPTSWPQLAGNLTQGKYHTMNRKCAIDTTGKLSIPDSLLLRAAWAWTVRQYSTSGDVVFAATLSGRDVSVPGATDLVGPMITTVPLRVKVSDTWTIAQYLDNIQDQSASMLDYQHWGLAEVQASQRKRGRILEPMHNFIVQPSDEKTPDCSLLATLDVKGDFDEYPLNVECSLSDGHIEIEAVFHSAYLAPGVVEKILDQFAHLTGLLARGPNDQRLCDLPVVNPSDLQWMMDLNKNVPERLDTCVHHEFEKTVVAQPSHQALCSFDKSFTYRELYETAKRLAVRLVELGVRPGSYVTLCFDKSSWAIVSMAATLLAGGACVNVSPGWPAQRLGVILEDTVPPVVLASKHHVGLFTNLHAQTIGVDEEYLNSCPSASQYVASTVQPSDPAFTTYTSGSSGKPKGVVVSHSSMATSALHHGTAFGLGQNSRCVQFSSYTFDASIQDIWTSLQLGGTICVISEYERFNALPEAIADRKANYADLTPTVAALINPTNAPSIKTISLGGEMMKESVLHDWISHARTLNTYGPTECAINSTWCEMTLGSTVANIGHGVGCVLWVVEPEDHNKLVPVGCVGELLIDGPIVGNGYLHDPEKTDAAFVADPTWLKAVPGHSRRMYKSGDLVKFSGALDGSVDYLGRKDQQVKINGQRLELGEIEHHVSESGISIKAVCVDAVKPSSYQSTSTLAAFVVFEERDGQDLLLPMASNLQDAIKSIKASLEGNLPPYMVPSLFFPISKMITNDSGKTDRKKLRAIVQDLSYAELSAYALSGQKKVKPSTENEHILAELWADILQIPSDDVSAEDNFFQVGGASIKAMQLSSLAKNKNMFLTVQDIFSKPVLQDMAKQLITNSSREISLYKQFSLCPENLMSSRSVIATKAGVTEGAVEDIMPATSLQEGLMAVTNYQNDAYIARLAYRIPAALDTETFKSSWETVAQAHPILRTRLVLHMEKSFQLILKEPIHWRSGDDLDQYLAQDAEELMGYGKPIARFGLVHQRDEHFFVLTLHHAAYDGWSLNVLFEHLERVYNGQEPSKPVGMGPVMQYLASQDQSVTDAYWRDRIEGVELGSWPNIPENHSTNSSSTIKRMAPISLPRGLTITESALLRAAWAFTMSLVAGTRSVVFGETLSGRDIAIPAASEVCGPLITTIPCSVHVDFNDTIAEFLGRVQSDAAGVIGHQHMGLQNIKRALTAGEMPELATLFIVQPRTSREDEQDALGLEAIDNGFGDFDTFPINVSCSLEDSQVELEINYDPSIVPENEMERIMNQFSHLLSQLNTQSVEIRLRDLQLLSEMDLEFIQRRLSAALTPEIDFSGHASSVTRSSSATTFTPRFGQAWVSEPDCPEIQLPVGALGELLLEDIDKHQIAAVMSDSVGLDDIDTPAWRQQFTNPFARDERFLKTSYLARQQADGSFVVLGRKDSIMKIHGRRVDVKGLEKTLSECKVVGRALIVLPHTGPCAGKLTALFTNDSASTAPELFETFQLSSQGDSQATLKRVQGFSEILEISFPSYMVPIIWVALETLPQDWSDSVIRNRATSWIESIENSTSSQFVDLDRVGAEEEPSSEQERVLLDTCSKVLNIPLHSINKKKSLIANGVDSISAMQIVSACRSSGVVISVAVLLRSGSIVEAASQARVTEDRKAVSYNEAEDSPFALSPIQELFFQENEAVLARHAHYNQSFYGMLAKPIAFDLLFKAVDKVISRHSMLRARFGKIGEKWHQRVVKHNQGAFHCASHTTESLEDVARLANHQQESLDVEAGPVFSVDLCNLPDNEQAVIMVAHHLVIDLVSWRLVLEELESLITSDGAALLDSLPFQSWIKHQVERAAQLDAENAEVLSTSLESADYAFWSFNDETPNTSAEQISESIDVDAVTTEKLLGDCNVSFGTEPVELLLAGLWGSFFETFKDRRNLTIFNEGHGRETWTDDVDVSRTVGWFTTMAPLNACRTDTSDLASLIRFVKDVRRQLPHNGFDYFTRRFLSEDGQNQFNSGNSTVEVLFNYHGQFQQLEKDDSFFRDLALDAFGAQSDEGRDIRASALIDIGVTINDGVTSYSFDWNRHLGHQDLIRQWLRRVPAWLEMISGFLLNSNRTLTKADYPLLELSYRELDRINALVDQVSAKNVTIIERVLPVSPMVEGILMSQSRDESAYMTVNLYEVRSVEPISIPRLIEAWQGVVARHEALRTVFVDAEDKTGPFKQFVLQSHTGQVAEARCASKQQVLQLLEQDNAPYEQHKPPHRATIYATTSKHTVFVKFELSHTITDGGSASIMISDLASAYSDGSIQPLPSVSQAFIESVRALSNSQKVKYWVDYLQGVEPCNFPRISDEARATTAANTTREIEGPELQTIQRFLEANSVTAFSLVQTAWAMTLAAYTGSSSVCFGYLASGRDTPNVPNLQEAMGAFVNMMVCRVDVVLEGSGVGLVEQTHSRGLQSLAHQHTPLADIQHALSLSGQPLFNSVLSFQRSDEEEESGQHGSLVFEDLEAEDPTEVSVRSLQVIAGMLTCAQYDIALDITFSDGALDLSLDYSRDCLSSKQAPRVLSHLRSLILHLASGHDLDLSPPVSKDDQSMLSGFNGSYPETVEDCVHSIIRKQVAQRPDAQAVSASDFSLTYAELDEMSEKLAHYLSGMGVKAGIMVPHCFVRFLRLSQEVPI